MRSLNKNKQKIWYALYEDRVPIYATDGAGSPLIDPVTQEMVETGRYTNHYQNPVEFEINISHGRASGEPEVLGVTVDYDRTLCTNDMSLPITETTLIWKETEPQFNDDGSVDPTSADYKVVSIPIASLNSLLIPIKRLGKTRDE